MQMTEAEGQDSGFVALEMLKMLAILLNLRTWHILDTLDGRL